MVIQKFNSLVRNKWFWSLFAVTVAAVFVLPDGCFRQSSDNEEGSADVKLPNLTSYDVRLEKKCKKIFDLETFDKSPSTLDILELVHLPNPGPYPMPIPLSMLFNAGEDVKFYAAVQTFIDAGVVITDEMLSEHIHSVFSAEDRPFNPEEYNDFIAKSKYGTVANFEESLRLALTLRNGLQTVEQQRESMSHEEVKARSQDYSDKFTVSVAVFNEDAKEVEKVKVDNAAVDAWYEENKESLALPDRYKVRYVKVPLHGVATTNLLAKVELSEESVEARYKENCDKGMYNIPTTNEVVEVKPLKDVRDAIVAELKGEQVKDMIEKSVYDMLNNREKDSRLLDDFVANNILGAKLKIEDAWFAFYDLPKDEVLDKYLKYGFITDSRLRFFDVNPRELQNRVCMLEKANDIIQTSAFIYLIYRGSMDEREGSHTPKLEDVRPVVESLVLDEARAQKFKSTVEAVKDKGLDAVVKNSGASTNIVFQLVNIDRAKPVLGEYQNQIIPEVLKLNKGEISEFTLLEPGKAFLVACQERIAGSAEDYERAEEACRFESHAQRQASMVQFMRHWLDWNLKRLGYNK